jgi:hypothetical protein
VENCSGIHEGNGATWYEVLKNSSIREEERTTDGDQEGYRLGLKLAPDDES